jgi:hypothetical protein
MTKDKDILLPLNKLLEANDRLDAAITETRKLWPTATGNRCWIDQMREPTKLLADHRLKANG